MSLCTGARIGFNSRPSCDGRLEAATRIYNLCNVSIHARLATGDGQSSVYHSTHRVSIHARLATGDMVGGILFRRGCFNSRPSCDGRQFSTIRKYESVLFQFTPVLRRATHDNALPCATCCFNSRPSCDGRLGVLVSRYRIAVSIHARLATGDHAKNQKPNPPQVSIHARLATGDLFLPLMERQINVSIHARLATGDVPKPSTSPSGVFQFTPVLRRATLAAGSFNEDEKFQFTPVLRRATRPTV